MLDIKFVPPPIWGVDFRDPGRIATQFRSLGQAIQRAFDEARLKGNNPKFIKVHGQTLERLIEGSAPWPGELKLFTGSLAQARAWARKYGWLLADGSAGPDLRHKFIRGASGANAGGIGGAETHTHTDTFAVTTHANHTHSFTPAGSIAATACPCVTACPGATVLAAKWAHDHAFSGSGGTTGNPDAPMTHTVTGSIDDATAASALPSYYEVIILVKGQWKA